MGRIIWESHSQELFENIYHIRKIWVLVFLEHEFWTGMRSTQRSKSMNAFFDKYLTCKRSLIQFVHQYDNCLADKEQKELECNAVDNRGLIPFPIGVHQLHISYAQAEFIKKSDCNLSPRVVKDNQYFDEVIEQKIVMCNCFMFELYGILHCHALSVLSHYRVDKVNLSYILSRWS
ncbi:hypothetical protein Ahy_B06g084191 [Arachis hypogaea]|uniref:Protein FAR1-RELATED SEQUENCE n=1 Tax=Arachis hypogaea TaxID=3818 RepID=A0A444YRB3_ARAHY|nr:hypothetical protein Ahy_B06g084191 [Arachis hypogaea]